eukprot:COSAG01_NODE_857_length_13073_cov_13.630415_13_plen_81_part_00
MGGGIFIGFINGRATALMMVGMIIFAVAWEAFTNYLDRRVSGLSAAPPPAIQPVSARPRPSNSRASPTCSSARTRCTPRS